MLTLVGILVMISVVTLLLSGRASPLIGLAVAPIIGALILGYNLNDLSEFLEDGFDHVISVAVMFIFAIIFFGIMNDEKVLNPLVNCVLCLTKGNDILSAIGTVIIGSIAHLDGSGATTFLVTIPAFLPIYKRTGMSVNLLVMLAASSIGIMNLLPWGGPIIRSAAVTDINVIDLWKPLIPYQIISFILLITFAGLLGWFEKRRLSKSYDNHNINNEKLDEPNKNKNYNLPLMITNWIIFIIILVLMIGDFLSPTFSFIIGLIIALPINYRKSDDQLEAIKRHSPNAINMAVIIIGAGVFLGILEGTGMLDAIATSIVYILPAVTVPFLHLIVGVFGLPLDLVTSTDVYYFALLDLVNKVVSSHGVDSKTVVYAMTIGNNFGAMISPLAPATWLGIGLAGISIGSHIRYSFMKMWAFSIVLLIVAIIFQVVP